VENVASLATERSMGLLALISLSLWIGSDRVRAGPGASFNVFGIPVSHGLEILNDDRTPMQFVVDMLNTHVRLSYHDSIRTMPQIHHRGGALLPTGSATEAQKIAAAVAAESELKKRPLACRAVSNAAKV
jgi:ATP-dependent Clp protease adapter protein ClpS